MRKVYDVICVTQYFDSDVERWCSVCRPRRRVVQAKGCDKLLRFVLKNIRPQGVPLFVFKFRRFAREWLTHGADFFFLSWWWIVCGFLNFFLGESVPSVLRDWGDGTPAVFFY